MRITLAAGDGNGLPAGDIQLYDNYLPSLDAGAYEITITPGLDGVDTGQYFQPITQPFEVRAPQFFLDATDVGELYPPPSSNGIYGTVLPTIVLNQRVLPWERLIGAGEAKSIPWVALLTLEPDDPVPDPTSGAALRTSTVTQFLAPDPNVLKPAIDTDDVPPDVLASPMQSVVLPADVFLAVTPKLDELPYLAHVRQTDTSNQASSDAATDGWYAIVVSNRFPDSTETNGAGTKNLVCLVSLEGFASVLPGGNPLPKKPDGTPQDVQLAVLATWTFVSNPAATESFAQLMNGFVTQEAGNPQNLLPSVVTTNPGPPAGDRLLDGYVPLTFHTQVGEETFAWYRGPFTPVVPQPLPPPPQPDGHYTSSSDVTIYVEDQGVFDLSYAAAFEMGRAIALSDRGFAIALLNARAQAYAKLNRIADRLATGRFDDTPLAELTRPNLTRKHFAALVDAGLAGALQETFDALPTSGVAQAPPRRGSPRPSTRELLGREDVQDVLAQHVTDDMDPVTDWLAHLALLYNVPFDQLVPDQRLLPVESIRFFYVDPGWIAALTDGALSIGVEGSKDLALHAAWREPLQQAVRAKTGLVRAYRRSRPDLAVETSGDSAPLQAGFLLRSAVVAGWPGLVVQADAGATPILRQDVLSENVMLVLFAGIPKTVTLSEPWHGLRFGVEDGDVIYLRGPDGARLGPTFPASGGFSKYLRTPSGEIGQRVIDVDRLVTALDAEQIGHAIGPALFATEMVQSPELLAFEPATAMEARA